MTISRNSTNPIFQATNRAYTKNPVKAAATSNITNTYYNGPLNNGVGATLTLATGAVTFDGISLSLNDRVLLYAQTNANENGIYVVNTVGATGIATVLQRAGDLQCAEQMFLGSIVPVQQGTVNSGALFVLSGTQPSAIGTDAITFVASSSTGAGTTFARTASNLSDLASVATAKTNLGIKRGTTAAYAGGGTSNAFTATGLAATDIVTATILASTNSVSITKAVPTTNTLTITFSADPGAGTTVQWHGISP